MPIGSLLPLAQATPRALEKQGRIVKFVRSVIGRKKPEISIDMFVSQKSKIEPKNPLLRFEEELKSLRNELSFKSGLPLGGPSDNSVHRLPKVSVKSFDEVYPDSEISINHKTGIRKKVHYDENGKPKHIVITDMF